MSEQKQLTEGQKRVRLGFNPSGLKRVFKYKTMIANTIDYLGGMEKKIKANSLGESGEDIGDFLREVATAKTSLQQASTMGVGAMTLPLAFKVLGDTQIDGELEIKTGEYTKKPVTIKIITFQDFVEFGRKNGSGNNAEGYPLSFTYEGHAITHESNTNYIVPTNSGHVSFTPDDVLITQVDGEIYPCRIDLFKQTYTN
jgi:hypothetical protein